MLLWRLDQLGHHCRELRDFDPARLVGVVVSEQLQHEPVQFHILGPSHIGDGLLNERLVLVNSALVNDGLNEKL